MNFNLEVSMKEQNSYAYVGNSKMKTVEKEGKRTLILSGVSPKECIKRIFAEEKIEVLESSLTKLVFTTKVNIEPDLFEVKVTIHNVKNSFYVDIKVEGKTRFKVIKCLEYIHKKLGESDLNTKSDYIQVITYDAISEYYCDKVSPALSTFERNLRHLLFSIYLVYFEQEYYLHQFDEGFEAKIKSGVQAKGNTSRKAIIIIQEAFYSLDFKTIEDMLFTDKFTKYEAKKIEKTLSKVENLSTLSDSELRSLLNSFLPKSDWERFFADKINGSDFKELFQRIRNNRNKVAHQKFFYKEDYLALKKDLEIFTKAIDQAVRITKDKEFSQQNRAYMMESFEGIQDSLKPTFEMIGKAALKLSEVAAKAMQNSLPSAKIISDMLTNISNSIYVPKFNLGDSIYVPKFNLGDLINEDESRFEDEVDSESDDEDMV